MEDKIQVYFLSEQTFYKSNQISFGRIKNKETKAAIEALEAEIPCLFYFFLSILTN